MSKREKAQWIEYIAAAGFFNFAVWDRSYLGLFLQEFDAYAKIGFSFPNWLLVRAQQDMTFLHCTLESKGFDTQINWKSIPCRSGTTMTESSADDLIYVWIQLKKIKLPCNPSNESDFANILATLLSIAKQEERKPRDTELHAGSS